MRVRSDRGSGEERRLPITVGIVDDDALVRSALSALLLDAGMLVVGGAGSGEAAIDLVVDTRPDVVLVDLGLPGICGVETIERVGLLAPATRVLVLTGSHDNLVVEAILAGASGYVIKGAHPERLVDAVRVTANGESVLSPEVAGKLLVRLRDQQVQGVGGGDAGAAIRALLTERELDIFARLASGNSNQEIGRALSVSPNTVSNHIASLLAKLHLENRVQAAVQAVRSGIA